jgi:copper chaperone CopZ
VENSLKSIHGVFDVTATLRNERSGEASVLYDPSGVTLEDLKQAIPTASGEKYIFRVISVIAEDLEK